MNPNITTVFFSLLDKVSKGMYLNVFGGKILLLLLDFLIITRK